MELGTIDDQLACFLQAAVRARMNIVVAGATDAGKTTLLRALINCIAAAERLITVERSLELGLRRHPELHQDVVELEEVLPDAEGNGGMTIQELVRRTRRHNPSRVIVGEVLGPEVVEMLSAMSQGNNGSLSTVHARSADDVFAKLAQYAGQYEHVDYAVAQSLIAGAVDFVVFIGKNRRLGGRRCVDHGAGGRGRTGRPGRELARSSTRSPVDGRAVAGAGCGDHRRAGGGAGRRRLRRHRRRLLLRRRAGLMGSVWLPVLLGAGIGGGVLLLIVGLRGVTVDPTRPPSRARPGGGGGPVAGAGRPDPGGGGGRRGDVGVDPVAGGRRRDGGPGAVVAEAVRRFERRATADRRRWRRWSRGPNRCGTPSPRTPAWSTRSRPRR